MYFEVKMKMLCVPYANVIIQLTFVVMFTYRCNNIKIFQAEILYLANVIPLLLIL